MIILILFNESTKIEIICYSSNKICSKITDILCFIPRCLFSLIKVAWIKSDSKAILAIHTHMVALNQRLSVTHNGHNAWKLHIAHVQLNDSGTYMCQVNTDPMRSQVSRGRKR